MPWPVCNQSSEYEGISEALLPGINIDIHRLGLGLSAGFGLAGVVLSFYLIWRHGTHYLKPYEQKQIIRILFMVPVYAVVSFLSFYYYKHSIYFEVLRDCYEAIAIASFFTLICAYIAPNLHDQKEYFRDLTPKRWLLPVNWFAKCCGGQRGIWRTPRSGLTWFNLIWFFVFQYCLIRVSMTIVSVISQAFDRYCLESLNPAFAHVWTECLVAVGVTIAMYGLIQFYYQLRQDIAQHSPFLKLLAIKLVIFLSFWQTIIISFLTSTNVIKASARIGAPDIKIGIPSLLLCMEMFFFAILHLYAYPWRVYDVEKSAAVLSESGPGDLPTKAAYLGGFGGFRAYWDALNLMDLVRGVGRGFRWIFVGRKHRLTDRSYKTTSLSATQLHDSPVDDSTGFGRVRDPKTGKYERLQESGSDRGRESLAGGSSTLNPGAMSPDDRQMEMGSYPYRGAQGDKELELGTANEHPRYPNQQSLTPTSSEDDTQQHQYNTSSNRRPSQPQEAYSSQPSTQSNPPYPNFSHPDSPERRRTRLSKRNPNQNSDAYPLSETRQSREDQRPPIPPHLQPSYPPMPGSVSPNRIGREELGYAHETGDIDTQYRGPHDSSSGGSGEGRGGAGPSR